MDSMCNTFQDESTLLQEAVRNGNVAMVKLLIQASDMNSADKVRPSVWCHQEATVLVPVSF